MKNVAEVIAESVAGFVASAGPVLGLALGLTLLTVSEVEAAPQRSCEAWQGASRQQLSGDEKWDAALVMGDSVQVYAAPQNVCACPGMSLPNHVAVYAYRSFHGFTRILYLERSSGVQISGWVKNGSLHHHKSAAI